jgi:ankyrin repeat protein
MDTLDYDGLRKALSQDPALANAGLPYDENNKTLAHPLHRICDGVFSGTYTDEHGVELAELFMEHGAQVNGFGLVEGEDTPLIAAASLHAEKVGMLYIDRGADILHVGGNGSTALHWAAWTGRDKLVNQLISAGAEIHRKDTHYKSTPLLWAVHGYKFGGGKNSYHQMECVHLLLKAGADKNTFNAEGIPIVAFLDDGDVALRALLS